MKFVFTIIILIYTGIKICLPVDASPILIIQEKRTKQSTEKISITTTAFNNIRSGDLTILYDPSVAKAKKITKNQFLGGTFHSNITNSGFIVIGWYAYPSVTLPDGTCLFEIEFERVQHGISNITFEVSDDYNCQFYDSFLKKLKDEPPDSHYLPGTLIFDSDVQLSILKVESVIHPLNCNDMGLITVHCTYLEDGMYTILYDGGQFQNIEFRSGTAQIDATPGIYKNLHLDLNNQKTPMGVNATVIDSGPMHVEVGLLVDSPVACEGAIVTFTAISLNEGINPIYNWYVNNIQVEGINNQSFAYQPEDNDEVFVQLISSETCAGNNKATSESRSVHIIKQIAVEIYLDETDTIIKTGRQVKVNAVTSSESSTGEYLWYLNEKFACRTYKPTFTFIPLDGDKIYVVYDADEPCLTGDNARSNTITMKVEATTSEQAIQDRNIESKLTCYPNPFSQSTTLNYTIPHNGIIDIELIKMNGVKFLMASNIRHCAGSHVLNLDCTSIPEGYYVLKFHYYSKNNIQFQKTLKVIKQ